MRKEVLIGVAVGIVVPILAFFVYYKMNTQLLSFVNTCKLMISHGKIATLALLTVLPSLAVYLLLFWRKQSDIARGVVVGTLAVALLEAVYYFLG